MPFIRGLVATIMTGVGDVIGFVTQNMPIITAIADLLLSNFRDGFNWVIQNMPAIKEAISRAFTQATPFIMGVIGFLGELRDMVKTDLTPIISYFVATFADGMTIVNGWFAENQDLVRDAVEGFRGFVKVGSQIVAWGAAFIGLGIGATLSAMAVYVLRVFAGYKRLYDYVAKYGVGGLIRDIGASFLMMRNDVLNALDEVLKGFIDMARGLPGADQLFGLDKMSAEITQRQMNRNFETNDAFSPPAQLPATPVPNTDDAGIKTNPPAVTVAPSITVNQTIQTSDPQAAAAAANRGVQRAVSRGVDPSKLGAPLTDPGGR
jgi:hypothetical protein